MYYFTKYNSPMGVLTIASDGKAIIGLWIKGQKYFAGAAPQEMAEKDNLPVFNAAKKWLDKYFAGKKPDISALPLAPIGGDFRRGVWQILTTIPYGEVITYGDIAKKMAKKMGKKAMSSQAVGGAVGHNQISIIIPCHRVVGANGNLTGFAGGIDKKIKLLKHEGLDMKCFYTPKKGTAL